MIALLASLLAAAATVAAAAALGQAWAARRPSRDAAPASARPAALEDRLLALDRRARLALAAAGALAAGGLGALGGAGPAFGLGALGALAPGLALRRLRGRTLHRLETQWVEALEGWAAALRAGRSFSQALADGAEEAPPPLGRELAGVVRRLRLGVPPDRALFEVAERLGSEPLHLTAVAAGLSRQGGGNTAEVFERLAESLRERFRLEGRVAALTSQGRLQGWIVALMPLALGLALHLLRPDLVGPMLAHPFGVVLVAVVAVSEGLGLWLIRRIVDIEP